MAAPFSEEDAPSPKTTAPLPALQIWPAQMEELLETCRLPDADLQELSMRLLGCLRVNNGATTETFEQQQFRRINHMLEEVGDEIADTHGEAFGVSIILLAALRPRRPVADG